METIKKEPIQSDVAQPVVPVVKQPLDFRIKIIIVVASILLILLVVIALLQSIRTPQPIIIPTVSPSPIVEFSPLPRVTSEYAKTDEFMKFELNLSTVQKDQTVIDLDESNLVFPLLDMELF